MAGSWLDFETPRIAIRVEIDRLRRVIDIGAPEAVILYAGRIVEATAAEAVARSGGVPTSNLYATLNELTTLNILPFRIAFWGHTVRRIGNDVRHMLRDVGGADADATVVFLARWLGWFFSGRFPVEEIAAGVPELDALAARRNRELAALAARLDGSPEAGPEASPDRARHLDAVLDGYLAAHEGGADLAPAIASVVADMLIQQDRPEAARSLLDLAIGRAPEDARLLQLRGLALSRLGRLDEAAALMEALMLDRPEDPETAGILGGVYKRQWERDRTRSDLLHRAARTYGTAWKQHRRTNTYLGINAATLALLDGRVDAAIEIATRVADRLRTLERRIAALPVPDRGLSFWDRLTLAEADLVTGDVDTARQGFETAARRHPDRSGDLEVAAGQARLIADRLGLPEDPFGPAPAVSGRSRSRR